MQAALNCDFSPLYCCDQLETQACEAEHASFLKQQRQKMNSNLLSRKSKKNPTAATSKPPQKRVEAEASVAGARAVGAVREGAVRSSLATHAMESGDLIEALGTYCARLSDAEPPLLQELRRETEQAYSSNPGAARMISGALQGRLLAGLSTISGATRILELGSFTGYSALCLADGLDGAADNAAEKRIVTTCEIDPAAAAIATKYFERFNEENSASAEINLLQKSADELIDELQLAGKQLDL